MLIPRIPAGGSWCALAAGGSGRRAGVAEQRYEAVSLTAKSSVTQNSVPKSLAAISLQSPEGNKQRWLQRGQKALFSQSIPLPGSGKVSVLLVWVREEGRTLSAPSAGPAVPWISADCSRRVHSHFSPKSQLVFSLPAVISQRFLGHERWPWGTGSQSWRRQQTSLLQRQIPSPGEQMTGGLASALGPLDVPLSYFNLSDL